jgi:YfiH family protein
VLALLPAGLPAPAAGVFTGRAGGVSRPPYAALNLGAHVGDEPASVETNRRRLAEALALEPDALVFAEQVHGPGVAVVSAADRGSRPVAGVDGLVTSTPGIALVMMAADCLPVLLADAVAGVVAAAHAGRQGLVAGVLQETVRVMVEQGATASRVVATVGPAICGRCYELPAGLVDEVDSAVPGTASRTRHGTPSVDLVAGARSVLAAAGVPAVTATGRCTVEQEDWFSYRRDGRTGRHAGLVWLPA